MHVVWGTKNRAPFLNEGVRKIICAHIKENAKIKGFYIDTIGGYKDHLHCLMPLNADISIAKQIQLIKGESSMWMNKNKILNLRFEWAAEYFAVSVCEDRLHVVRAYINNQEEHHKKITFTDEYENFLKESGFSHG